jgi:oligoribonuclease
MRHLPLLFFDLETTCLSPHTGYLLEVGMVLTDADLRVVDSFGVVIGWRGVRSFPMPQNVRDMHERSGLLDAVERSNVCVRQAELLALEWAKGHGIAPDPQDGIAPDPQGRDNVGPYMAGASPQFDRGWAQLHLPTLARIWHYRNVDLTTLRYFFGTKKREVPHRALADCLENVEELQRLTARAAACGLTAMPPLAVAG